jgi:hypothetical protein
MTLIEHLIDQLGVSRQQAEGATGLLLQQAQARLSSDDFLQVADAIPAISDLIGKAPRHVGPGAGSLRALWQGWWSSWSGLASLRPAFEKLGLDRAAVEKFVAVIGRYFREQGGAELETLLVRAWQ